MIKKEKKKDPNNIFYYVILFWGISAITLFFPIIFGGNK